MSEAEMPGTGGSEAAPAPGAPAPGAPAPGAPAPGAPAPGAPAAWGAAPASSGGAELYGGRRGAGLTITDALTAGYKFLLNPDFSVPILVIGVVIQLIVLAIFVPLITGVVLGNKTSAADIIGGLLGGIFATVIAGVVGGILLNLYGQVWALEASNGNPLKMAAAFTQVGARWINILGAGLIVGVIEIGALIVLGIIAAILGGLGALLFVVGLIAIAYVGIRLSMSGWLAADGAAPLDAVKASWALTNRHLMTIIIWSIVIGVVVAVITMVLGIVLNLVPLIGPALTGTVGTAFGFGAGATLYHRVKDA
jgi:hypothetical protein